MKCNSSETKICYLVPILCMLISGCGGSSSNNAATFFDGAWSSTLTGKDCLNNDVSLSVVHDVDSDSEELGATVQLFDRAGFEYQGIVQVGTNNTVGFFVTLEDGSITSTVPGSIRYDNIRGGSADVTANFSISKTCVYELSGTLFK